ncbi:DinB family protein [Jatrophihabitans fulvus]
MTAAIDLLLDAYGRVRERVHAVLEDADETVLTARLDPEANTVGWLVWHLLRVQDDHVAGVAGTEQVWTSKGWHERFGLPFAPEAHGYGHSSDDVAQVRDVPVADFRGYADDVLDATEAYLRTLRDDDLARVVDENWDPPVTLAVRLMSVVDDDLEHAGQAAFVRGVLRRR